MGDSSCGMIADCLGDKEAKFRCTLEREDVRGISVVMVNQLSIEMRLFHHVIAWILAPRIGRSNFIIKRELMLLVVLIQGTTMNLSRMMVRQIQEVMSSRRLCLPYRMGLTHIFRV